MPYTPETLRSHFQHWPERTGLPAALATSLPTFLTLFALEGLPAWGVAVLSALSGSERARRKMRDFGGAVDAALRDLGFRGDVGPGVDGAANPELAAERVNLLQETLSSAQLDQLGVLFEDYMRSSDPEWGEVVLRAARAVVKDAVDEGARRTVVARLPLLSLPHLRELQRIKERPERTRPRLGRRPPEATALQVVLLQAGLVKEVPTGEDPPTGAAFRAAEPPRNETELRPTTLGLAALRMFGPIEIGER